MMELRTFQLLMETLGFSLTPILVGIKYQLPVLLERRVLQESTVLAEPAE